MKKRRFNPARLWVGFLIFLACLIGLLLNGGKRSQELPRAQYDDKSPLGGRGLRLVAEKLGYSTAKQTLPLQKMPADAKVWLLLDPETAFSAQEATLLLDWVKRGGLLVFCVQPDSPIFSFGPAQVSEGIQTLHSRLGIESSSGNEGASAGDILPHLMPLSLDVVSRYRSGVTSASGSARNFEMTRVAPQRPALEIAGLPGGDLMRLDWGTGHVFVAPDALLFTNYALSHADNAVLVTNLIRAHAPGGTIYFDERQHGNETVVAAPETLISHLKKPPVSYAMLQLLAAALLFWAFAGRRLGTPVALPSSGPVTRASQFAGAMGALFLKTNRPQAAASLIGTRFRRRLALRLGLSPAETDSVLARRAQEVAGIPFEETDRLLLQSRAPASNVNQALRDAQDMERVLQKLEGR